VCGLFDRDRFRGLALGTAIAANVNAVLCWCSWQNGSAASSLGRILNTLARIGVPARRWPLPRGTALPGS
jgi:hypothetical protein